MEQIAESKASVPQSNEEKVATETEAVPNHNSTPTVPIKDFEEDGVVRVSELDGFLESSKTTIAEKSGIVNDLVTDASALESLILAERPKLLNRNQNSEVKNKMNRISLEVKEIHDDDLELFQNEKLEQTATQDDQTTNQDIAKNENGFIFHPLLLEYDQCFFNWIPDDNPLTLEEADIIIQNTTSRSFEDLELYPLKLISQHLTIAFLRLFQSKLIEATEDLNKVVQSINVATESKFISNDYNQGFMYLVTGLEAFKKSLVINSTSPGNETAVAVKDLELFVAQSRKFQDLPNLAQALIKGANAVFVGCRKLKDEEKKLLKEVTTEDQGSVEWFTYLFGVSRERRRESNLYGPSKDEKQSLLGAIALDDKHVMVKLCRCIYLSDAIRKWQWRNILRIFQEFTSIEEVVNFIKTETKEILMMDDYKNNKIILTIADIFGFILRSTNGDFRDVPLAKKCLQDALTNNPKSSRANHKMGLLLLTGENNPDEAKKYIKEAVVCDPRNFSALIDVVHILLIEPNKNAEELRKIFNEQIKPQHWSQKRLADLIYNQGIHHYMLGEKDAAVKAWIFMYQTDPKRTVLFKKLSDCSDRYLWDKELVSITNFQNHFLQIVSSKGSSLTLNPVPNVQEVKIIFKLFEVLKSIKPAKYQYVNKAFKDESSSSLHSDGQWRGPNERRLPQGATRGTGIDGNWRRNE